MRYGRNNELNLGSEMQNFINYKRALSLKTGNMVGYISALQLDARSSIFDGRLGTAIDTINKAIDLSVKGNYPNLLAKSHHTKGVFYSISGSSELAVEQYKKAIDLNERNGNSEEVIKQYNNIALILRDIGEYESALTYLRKATKLIEERRGTSTDLGAEGRKLSTVTQTNIAYVKIKQEKYEEAEKELVSMSGVDYGAQTSSVINYLLAECYYNLGSYSKAKLHANRALRIAEENGYAVGKIYSYRILCDVLRKEKNYALSKKYGYIALDVMYESESYIYYEELMSSIVETERVSGNHEKAFLLNDQKYQRQDSLQELQFKEKITNSQLDLQVKINEKENELLKIENLQNLRIQKLQFFVLALFGLVVFLALRAYLISRRYNKDLKLAIKERTQELAQSNEELERFTYISSHDLKEPVRNLVTYSTLLLKDIESKDTKVTKEYVQSISGNAKQLYMLIEDILGFFDFKAASGDIEMVEIDLNQVIDDIKDLLMNNSASREVEITASRLPMIVGKKSLIFILFKNLIENGIKYNDSNPASIQVSAEALGDQTKISVKDNGIGIDMVYSNRIFEMFRRLHNKSEYEGSGLGLSICNQIAEMHDFELGLESEVGEGSSFYVLVGQDNIVDANSYA